MVEKLVSGLPWVLSASSLAVYYLAGNKHRLTWKAGIANEMLWLVWILLSGTYGLLPLNIGLFVIFVRNHYKWLRN